MTLPSSPGSSLLENRVFTFLVIAVTLAFAWILWPLAGAILWGVVIAIVFMPLYRRLLRSSGQRPTLAALATLGIILVIVILPVSLVAAALLQEASGLVQRIQSGDIDIGRSLRQAYAALPGWVVSLLNRLGLTDLGAVQDRVSAGLTRGIQTVVGQALNIGQNTLNFVVSLFVMLYLLFYLLRDGDALAQRIRRAIPLRAEQQRQLFDRFTVVIRATVKGNLVVALAQGALGGLMFWFLGIHAPVLWGVLMALFSLLPALGAAVVWLPVAFYLVVTGSTWEAIALTAWGTLVIGTVDNLLRPLLVGKDTKMPDYVVLISTLGGIAIFGINGFVIGPVIAALFITVWDSIGARRSHEHGE
ncbi:MAG TPA: AI-2E family transporter [Gemmatimonadales bacterium]|nr:AI-2E family transporter [Gemmatimonadales bacterium]